MAATGNANILLLSSSAADQGVVEKELVQAGSRVVVVSSVRDALMALKDAQFSLFIFELNAATSDRQELLRRLKMHKTLKLVPVMGIVSPLDSSAWKQWEKDGIADFLIKPINVGSLRSKVGMLLPGGDEKAAAEPPPERSAPVSNAGLLEELKQKIYSGAIELPSQPRLLHRLIELMQDDRASLKSIGDLLEKEPSVSARVLRAANSVQFASSSKARTTAEALGRVGLDRALNYVMVLSNDQMFDIETAPLKEIREKLWRHTLTTAVASKLLGVLLGYSRPDALFAYGLLHDVGKLVLLRILQGMPEKLNGNTPVASIESALNRLHCELGASVFEQWNFPQEFSLVSRYHHQPPVVSKHGKYLIIIGFANLLAHEMEFELNEKLVKGLLRTPHAAILKIRFQQISDLEKQISAELQILESLM